MTDLVLKELRLRQAQLDLKAEKMRSEWRTLPATGPRAAMLGKQVKDIQKQADDWANLIEAAGAL